MTRLQTQLRPSDDGRRMSLEEFEFAEAPEGQLYELNKGVVVMMDVPSLPHAAQVYALREQLSEYNRRVPSKIKAVLGSMECKVLLQSIESERHPDLSIYCSMPELPNNWATWIPEIVVEVLSPSSRQRDYEDKPDEYFQFGAREYWIVDRPEQSMLVHRRVGGRWVKKTVRPPEIYTCRLLPGLEIDIAKVFAAADAFE